MSCRNPLRAKNLSAKQKFLLSQYDWVGLIEKGVDIKKNMDSKFRSTVKVNRILGEIDQLLQVKRYKKLHLGRHEYDYLLDNLIIRPDEKASSSITYNGIELVRAGEN